MELLVKKIIFGQKYNFWSKIEFTKSQKKTIKILVKIKMFDPESKFLSKIEIWSKTQILVKNRDFEKKIEILVKKSKFW